jgi:hypothetical protein
VAAAGQANRTLIDTIFGGPASLAGEPGIEAADPGTSVSPRIDMRDCQVDAVIEDSYSGAALIVADLTYFSAGPATLAAGLSAIVDGNRLRSRFPSGEAALLLGAAQAAVTGNLIGNEAAVPVTQNTSIPGSFSLTIPVMSMPLGGLMPALMAAGNVFIDASSIAPSQIRNGTVFPNTEVNYAEVPTVTSISPQEGFVGTPVTINGTGFTATSGVSFGGTSAFATATVVSDTEITTPSPEQAVGTVDITVTTAAGTSATSDNDKFTYQPRRVVTG